VCVSCADDDGIVLADVAVLVFDKEIDNVLTRSVDK
jgi:hypothetical protein